MAVDPSLIFSVRRQLNDVPEDYLSDETIYQALTQADQYLSKVFDSSVDTTYREHCLVVLAAYYAYAMYVSSIERGLGGMPAAAEVRFRMLRELALSLIRLASKFNIRDDFSIDESVMERPIVGRLTGSVLDG